MEKLSNPRTPDPGTPADAAPRPAYACVQTGNPKAAMAIWAWKASRERTGSASGAAGHARREGAIRAAVGAALGTGALLLGHPTLATVIWSIAGLTLLAALASPLGVYRWIQRGIGALAHGVGVFLSWLLLPVFFFGFCLVFGLLARRGRKDRLERWFDEGAPTYWKERNDPPRKPEFYERQS